jgi:acid-sensing ion channel, other
MDNFACESTIAGARVFHTSESKKARIFWLFVNFLAFVLIAFYVLNIYTRYKIEPEFLYEFSQIPLQEIPFPAVTLCSPLFARNQTVNLKNFLKYPTKKLTAEEQNLLAANVQACAPHFGSKVHKFCPRADPRNTIKALKSKFLNIDESFNRRISYHDGCSFIWQYTQCSKILNYVLTDYGFCFTFNLESFSTIFNTEIISNDFKCYSRSGKIVQNYYPKKYKHKLFIDEANQSIDWTLEKGFKTHSRFDLPVRAMYKKNLSLFLRFNATDLSNLCPEMGKRYLLFMHMPNEILTPFHQPKYIQGNTFYYPDAKLHKVDESLRSYPPQKRNCYFEDERKLKFFKTYTKALCDFECLANFTLVQCGCVKFSMPRENSTRICGLNETSCYIEVAKNWNLTCGCLKSCTYITYDVIKSTEKKNLL